MSIQLTNQCTNKDDMEYEAWIERMNQRFVANIQHGKEPLFTTDADDIWEVYLAAFEHECVRQYHNCSACRHFIRKFGTLVTIGDDGLTSPAFWSLEDAPTEYHGALLDVIKHVRNSRVTGVFMSSDAMWGTPVTGDWHHYAIKPPKGIIYTSRNLTASQAMAEKREDFRNVSRSLAEFTLSTIQQALTLLDTDSLYRSEKVKGPAQWLHDLHVARNAAKNKQNIVWRAIATAPAGFCHPRSSMVGTLLEDIVAGMSFDEVSRRFKDKMHPLQYQRPQAAPTAGAIAAAEKVMEKLGAAGSLERRFARLEEVQAIWRPTEGTIKKPESVFGHLKTKAETEQPQMSIPAQVMTWDKFQRTVLPTATRIQYLTKYGADSFTSLVTAVNLDAPPILQWDSKDNRNPVSWYFWHGGSSAQQFGLQAAEFVEVNAVCFKPSMWNGGNEHQGKGVMFVLDGAQDSRMPGAALFPEILKSELHGIRSVIEAYSRSAEIQGQNEQSAAGVMFTAGDNWNATLRVWSGGKSLDYKLDRWD